MYTAKLNDIVSVGEGHQKTRKDWKWVVESKDQVCQKTLKDKIRSEVTHRVEPTIYSEWTEAWITCVSGKNETGSWPDCCI